MKALSLLAPIVLPCLLGACLSGVAGCAAKPAPARPSQLFSSDLGMAPGGDMRLGADNPGPRNPPRLPIVVKDTSLASASAGSQPPPPPPPTLKSSAIPKVVSPVSGEADGYFSGGPAQPTALGALFDSLFVPPAPPAPTAISTATYQEVK